MLFGSRFPQIQATHPWSHCRRRVLLGYPRFPTGYPHVFKGEMHYLQLQLCLEELPIWGFLWGQCYWSKIEENMGKKSQKSQCKKATEQRGKRNQLSGCLETAWALLEHCFFLCSELFLPPQHKHIQEETGLRTAQSQLWRMELISQIGIRFMFCNLNHSRSCHKPVNTVLGPCPSIHSCNFWPTQHNSRGQGSQQNVGADFYCKKRDLNWRQAAFQKKRASQEVDSGCIHSFPDGMSLPVGLYLLKRSKRPQAHTHC